MFHDGNEKIYRGNGVAETSWAPLRLVMSHKVTHFQGAAYGDQLISFEQAGGFGIGTGALARNFVGENLILGTPGARQSFVSNVVYGNLDPRPEQLELTFYTGMLQIGSASAAARAREIALTANSYSDSTNSVGPFGASFYYNATGFPESGNASTAAETQGATIVVIPSAPSAAVGLVALIRGRRRRDAC